MSKKVTKVEAPVRRLTPDGLEVPDPTPLAASLKFKAPMSINDRVRMLVRSSMQAELDAAGIETFEEANDFDCDDPADFDTPWEEDFEGAFDHQARMESQHYEDDRDERGRIRGRRPRPPKKQAKPNPRSSEEDDQPGASAAPRKKTKKITRPSVEIDDEE